MPSPTLSAPSLRVSPSPPSPSRNATPTLSSRRWTTRLRDMLTFRSRRSGRPSSVGALSTDSASSPVQSTAPRATPPSRRRLPYHCHRRHRRFRQSTTATVRNENDSASAGRLSSRTFRFPPTESEPYEPSSAQSYPLRRGEYAVRRAGSLPSTAAVSSAFADIDAIPERDLFAVMDRFLEEYNVDTRVAGDSPPAAPLYVGRLPPHTRRRVAMTVQNAYYVRRAGRHSHLSTELERDFRWGVRTLRLNPEPNTSTAYDYAASDDQIEALPTFVMEKGETRSVQQIFAAMGAPEHEKIICDDPSDECDGLMTSYTECAICLSDFEAGDEITLLPCGHFFHLTGCVREWLRNHASTCPTCRADICTSNTSSSDELGSHSATVATSEEIS